MSIQSNIKNNKTKSDLPPNLPISIILANDPYGTKVDFTIHRIHQLGCKEHPAHHFLPVLSHQQLLTCHCCPFRPWTRRFHPQLNSWTLQLWLQFDGQRHRCFHRRGQWNQILWPCQTCIRILDEEVRCFSFSVTFTGTNRIQEPILLQIAIQGKNRTTNQSPFHGSRLNFTHTQSHWPLSKLLCGSETSGRS